MDRAEIMALSQRDLDAAVAEHVMGLIMAPELDVAQYRRYRPYPVDDPMRYAEVPSYSTDMSACWQAVQRMVERDEGWLPWLELSGPGEAWECGMAHVIYDAEVEYAEDPTEVPAAWCRTMLLALSDKGGDNA